MKILNYGSLNLDYFFNVNHIVRPGETILATAFEIQCGGKGLNQSVALAKAEAQVYHAGKIGVDGAGLIRELKQAGVNTDHVAQDDHILSGNAIIQIDGAGQNSIILYGGANQTLQTQEIEEVFRHFDAGDYLVLQNEINLTDQIIVKARGKGMKIFINLAPMNDAANDYPLCLTDCIMINEIEGEGLTGQTDPGKMLDAAMQLYPDTAVLLTLGAEGALYQEKGDRIFQPIYNVPVVNTTGAGDTFCGYFIAALSRGQSAKAAMDLAARASAITVSRHGSAASIPTLQEVSTFIR